MRSNDLVPYLGNGGGSGNSKRQGVIVSWDPDNGDNVVNVGGALLENLPFYNSTEASLLSPGDVVVVETFGGSFAILGRIFYPGTPEAVSAFQAITSRVQGATDDTDGTRNSLTFGDLTGTSVGPSVTVRIGTSGKAWVCWSAEIGQTVNGVGSLQWMQKNTPHVGVEISGANTVPAVDGVALNLNLEHPAPAAPGEALSSTWIQCAMTYVFVNLNPGLTTFTMKYRHDGLEPVGTNTSVFRSRSLIVFPL
jgi:hypothetical protein